MTAPVKPAAPHRARGGCFVVLSEEGLFWDGQRWVPDWPSALKFAGPNDPSAECQALADALRLALGLACNVCYIPRAKVAGGQVPDPKPRG